MSSSEVIKCSATARGEERIKAGGRVKNRVQQVNK